MADSISFDRAAEYYDRTRVTDPEGIRAAVDVLEAEFTGRAPVLEIGVGTGALALPVHERGISVVGLDLSEAMLRKLAEKAGGAAPFPLSLGDATRLPFGDDSLGGAFARWVLHLIANWQDAVAELCRTVEPGGVIVIEPGGYAGRWRDIWLRFREELGERSAPIGLDIWGDHADLDEAFAAHGAIRRALPVVTMSDESTMNSFLEEVRDRRYSWTWRIPDEEMAPAVERIRAWAAAEYGDLDAVVEPDAPMRWRAYDVA